jgi:hypothetical protein
MSGRTPRARYLERRDPGFKQKMAEVLCLYARSRSSRRPRQPPNRAAIVVAIISYDEEPAIQAITYHLPMCEPPSTCSTSPVTCGASDK